MAVIINAKGTSVSAFQIGKGGTTLTDASGVSLTIDGQFIVPASTTSAASLRLPHGTAPTSPTDGDFWTTTGSAFVRINGSTIDFGGNVSNTGTPVNNQLAIWTDATTIEGDANLTWDASTLQVTGTIEVANAAGGSLVNEAATATNPTLIPDKSDPDTGVGHAADNALSLIAGGVETIRFTEASSEILVDYSFETGITASTTQTQGQRPLLSSYNEVSVVANSDDTVTLPAAAEGRWCLVINSGANKVQVFPASGDDLGQGVDASDTIKSGTSLLWIAFDGTTWHEVATKLSRLQDVDIDSVNEDEMLYRQGGVMLASGANLTFNGTCLSAAEFSGPIGGAANGQIAARTIGGM